MQFGPSIPGRIGGHACHPTGLKVRPAMTLALISDMHACTIWMLVIL